MPSSSGTPPSSSRLDRALDLLGKLAIPAAGLLLAYLTWNATGHRDTEQSEQGKAELRQKDSDLFLKQSDLQRAKDNAKADFLQKNLPLLTSGQPGAMRQLDALIDASFSSLEDALDVKAKAKRIHDSAAEPAEAEHARSTAASSEYYKALGFRYSESGYFAEAQISFGNAVDLAPTDIQAWNALAYAQMRGGDADRAFASISRAIDLKPTDPALVRIIPLNATKILCDQGKREHALAYLNVAIDAISTLKQAAKGDGELANKCNFQFN